MLTTRFRFALVAATLFAVGLCPRVYSSENPFKFVGRWRSDEGRLFNSERYPSGYWVIDRYPSGHYGKRQYLVAPEDGSLEMSVEWGQWAVRRGRYYETPWGTTSSLLKGWVGEPRAAKILDLTKKDFTFLRGQLRRRETRIFDDTK